MNEDTRKIIPSGQEMQNNELNEEQLDEVTGGLLTVRLGDNSIRYNRQCAANPSHKYYASGRDDLCPLCGAKGFNILRGN